MFQVTIGVWLSVYIISACHREGGDVCILSKNNKIQKPRVTTWCWVHLIHITIWHLYFCPFHRFTYSICYHLMKKTKKTKNTKKPYKIFWRKKRYLLYPRFHCFVFNSFLFFYFIFHELPQDADQEYKRYNVRPGRPSKSEPLHVKTLRDRIKTLTQKILEINIEAGSKTSSSSSTHHTFAVRNAGEIQTTPKFPIKIIPACVSPVTGNTINGFKINGTKLMLHVQTTGEVCHLKHSVFIIFWLYLCFHYNMFILLLFIHLQENSEHWIGADELVPHGYACEDSTIIELLSVCNTIHSKILTLASE